MTLQELNLASNPFEFITPTPNKEIFWAGMEKQKKDLLKVYNDTFSNTARKVVLNWGPIGGGKTHAAHYFCNNQLEDIEDDQIISCYIRIPKEGKNANIELIKSIFDSISIRKAKKEIDNTLKEVGREPLLELINERIQSEAFSETLIKLGNELSPPSALQKYLFSNPSATELRKLNVPRALKTDSDYIKFLSAAIIAMTSGSKPKRFFLWIDEMEDLLYYSSKEYKRFAQLIRDLTDTINERMAIFMNITLTEGEDDNIKLMLGDAMWSRINTKIRFTNLSIDEAFIYCKDLIQHAQIQKKDDCAPFDEETARQLLASIPKVALIPREINRNFNDLLSFALEQEQQIITMDVLKDWQRQG